MKNMAESPKYGKGKDNSNKVSVKDKNQNEKYSIQIYYKFNI